MGGLLKKMPVTAITFLVGTLALTAVPFTAGFYSKEEILYAAKGTPLFYLAAFVALLTTFYMLRLFIVAFLGKPREHGAKEAKEVAPIMSLPLILLAIMAFAAPHISQIFPVPTEWGFHFKILPDLNSSVFWTSIGVFVTGAVAAFVVYSGKDKDPINIPLFRNKFYLDEIYQKLITICQDAVAAIIHLLDEFLIGVLLVGGATRSAQGVGNIFRRFAQNGSLSNYAYLMALGSVLVIYFTVFA